MPEEMVTQELISQLTASSLAFDVMCKQRWENGEGEYGPRAFLGNDVLKMAKEEVVDLANYARMAFMKIELLEIAVKERMAFADGQFIPVTDPQGA